MTYSQAATNGHTREKVGIDELTGVWNRPGFIAASLPLFDSCRRREAPVALAFFEFDTESVFGADEPIVDQVLMGMAEMMRKARAMPLGPERRAAGQLARAFKDLAKAEAWLEGQTPRLRGVDGRGR